MIRQTVSKNLVLLLALLFGMVVIAGLAYLHVVSSPCAPRPFPDETWVLHGKNGPYKVTVRFSDGAPAAYIEMSVRTGGIPSRTVNMLLSAPESASGETYWNYPAYDTWSEAPSYSIIASPGTEWQRIILDATGQAKVDLGVVEHISVLPADPLCFTPAWKDPDAHLRQLWSGTTWNVIDNELVIYLAPSTMRLRISCPALESFSVRVAPPASEELGMSHQEAGCWINAPSEPEDDLLTEERMTYERTIVGGAITRVIDIPMPPFGAGGYFGLATTSAKLQILRAGSTKLLDEDRIELSPGAIFEVDLRSFVGRRSSPSEGNP